MEFAEWVCQPGVPLRQPHEPATAPALLRWLLCEYPLLAGHARTWYQLQKD